jgi:hypothetical protein
MSAIGSWDDTGSVVPSKTDAARRALLCESRLNDSLENPSNAAMLRWRSTGEPVIEFAAIG